MEQILELRNVVKNYGSFRAVDGLDLDIYKGDVFGFLGPNGAGKSTTIRMITTLIRPDSGSINIFGMPLSENKKEILSRIGCIVERPDFYRYLSARRNLELLAELSGKPVLKKQIDYALELTGLADRAADLVKNYSHGMKQRLGLAQALMHDPEFIILDEPTTGLDPHGIIDIRNLIVRFSQEKKITVLLSSHLLSEIELIATRMAIINKGKTIIQGSVSDLTGSTKVILTIKCNDNSLAASLIRQHFELQPVEKATHIEINAERDQVPVIAKLLVDHNLQLSEISAQKKLENMYLQLTNN